MVWALGEYGALDWMEPMGLIGVILYFLLLVMLPFFTGTILRRSWEGVLVILVFCGGWVVVLTFLSMRSAEYDMVWIALFVLPFLCVELALTRAISARSGILILPAAVAIAWVVSLVNGWAEAAVERGQLSEDVVFLLDQMTLVVAYWPVVILLRRVGDRTPDPWRAYTSARPETNRPEEEE